MSCFICGKETIDSVCSVVGHYLNSPYEDPDIKARFKCCFDSSGIRFDPHKLYRLIYIQNIRAYNGRYDEHENEFPKFTGFPPMPEDGKQKLQLFDSFGTYLYQCAEDPVYNSPFYKAVNAIYGEFAVDILTHQLHH